MRTRGSAIVVAVLASMFALLVGGCGSLSHQRRFVGSWRASAGSTIIGSAYIRVYPDGWVAQWPVPVGYTSWCRLEGDQLIWNDKDRGPVLSIHGKTLHVRLINSFGTFDRIGNVEPPLTDDSVPGHGI